MSAKEMFEALGMKKIENNLNTIMYEIVDKNNKVCRVTFYLNYKEYYVNDFGYGNRVGVALHKAIHQQIKELGWLYA